MSAPFIIPFNYEPISTVASTSGTYTVPAGKYAKVVISNAILPVLNSVALYHNKSILNTSTSLGVSSVVIPLQPTKNVHRITFFNQGATAYFRLGSVAVTTANYHYTGGTSFSITMSSPVDVDDITGINPGSYSVTSITVDICNMQEIWLKAGDVFTYSGGSIVYSEFNSIS